MPKELLLALEEEEDTPPASPNDKGAERPDNKKKGIGRDKRGGCEGRGARKDYWKGRDGRRKYKEGRDRRDGSTTLLSKSHRSPPRTATGPPAPASAPAPFPMTASPVPVAAAPAVPVPTCRPWPIAGTTPLPSTHP